MLTKTAAARPWWEGVYQSERRNRYGRVPNGFIAHHQVIDLLREARRAGLIRSFHCWRRNIILVDRRRHCYALRVTTSRSQAFRLMRRDARYRHPITVILARTDRPEVTAQNLAEHFPFLGSLPVSTFSNGNGSHRPG